MEVPQNRQKPLLAILINILSILHLIYLNGIPDRLTPNFVISIFWKSNYSYYYKKCLALLRPSRLIAIDNVL
ncbi:MAG: hypothetical protein AAGF66_19825 [Cyanobacteria bacterium P01_H01_bin.119]